MSNDQGTNKLSAPGTMPFTETMRRLLRVKKEEIQTRHKQPGKGQADDKDSKTPERK